MYVYDVNNGKTLEKSVNYILPTSFVFNFTYPKSDPNFAIMKESTERLMKIAMMRQSKYRLDEIIKKAWDTTIGVMIPEGQKISEEAERKFNDQLEIELEPYLYSLFRKSRGN